MARRSSEDLKEVIRDFRRDQLIDVARRLFGERGTVEVSIDEIAAEAGVARSTVYVYFANRDELLGACLNRMYEEVQEAITAVFAGPASPEQRLRAVVAGMLDRIDEHPSFFLLAVATQAAGREPGAAALGAELLLIGLDMARILEDLVAEGIDQGHFAAIDPARAAALIGQQLFGALSVRAGDPSPLPAAAATTEICDFLLHGLRARSDAEGVTVNFDLWLPTANPFTTPELLAEVATQCEDRGIARIWVGEHVVLFDEYASRYPYAADGRIPAPPGSGLFDPLNTLSFLAALTSTVRLATGIVILAQRNPVYTAKEVATLDWLSNGRTDLGVGVGWLREEYEACNVDFARRGARTDEYLELLRVLWCEDPSAHDGEFYRLPPCSMFPKPVQSPHPPIHIGGESDAALRRVARFGQGWHTFDRLPEDLPAPLRTLEGYLDEADRTRGDVSITVSPYFQELTPERVEGYAEAGADAVSAMFFAGSTDDVGPMLDALTPCVERARAC